MSRRFAKVTPVGWQPWKAGLAQLLRSPRPTANDVVDVLTKMRNQHAPFQLLVRAASDLGFGLGLPSLTMLHVLAKSCAEDRRWSQALTFLHPTMMQSLNLAPDQHTTELTLYCCDHHPRWEQACALIAAQMASKETVPGVSSPSDLTNEPVMLYAPRALLGSGHWMEAFRLFNVARHRRDLAGIKLKRFVKALVFNGYMEETAQVAFMYPESCYVFLCEDRNLLHSFVRWDNGDSALKVLVLACRSYGELDVPHVWTQVIAQCDSLPRLKQAWNNVPFKREGLAAIGLHMTWTAASCGDYDFAAEVARTLVGRGIVMKGGAVLRILANCCEPTLYETSEWLSQASPFLLTKTLKLLADRMQRDWCDSINIPAISVLNRIWNSRGYRVRFLEQGDAMMLIQILRISSRMQVPQVSPGIGHLVMTQKWETIINDRGDGRFLAISMALNSLRTAWQDAVAAFTTRVWPMTELSSSQLYRYSCLVADSLWLARRWEDCLTLLARVNGRGVPDTDHSLHDAVLLASMEARGTAKGLSHIMVGASPYIVEAVRKVDNHDPSDRVGAWSVISAELSEDSRWQRVSRALTRPALAGKLRQNAQNIRQVDSWERALHVARQAAVNSRVGCSMLDATARIASGNVTSWHSCLTILSLILRNHGHDHDALMRAGKGIGTVSRKLVDDGGKWHKCLLALCNILPNTFFGRYALRAVSKSSNDWILSLRYWCAVKACGVVNPPNVKHFYVDLFLRSGRIDLAAKLFRQDSSLLYNAPTWALVERHVRQRQAWLDALVIARNANIPRVWKLAAKNISSFESRKHVALAALVHTKSPSTVSSIIAGHPRQNELLEAIQEHLARDDDESLECDGAKLLDPRW